MPKITIEVTQANIKAGKVESYMACPIACAIRSLGPTGFDGVTEESIDFSIPRKSGCLYDSVLFYTPKSAVDFIKKFDKKGAKAVGPFKFTLNFSKKDFDSVFPNGIKAPAKKAAPKKKKKVVKKKK